MGKKGKGGWTILKCFVYTVGLSVPLVLHSLSHSIHHAVIKSVKKNCVEKYLTYYTIRFRRTRFFILFILIFVNSLDSTVVVFFSLFGKHSKAALQLCLRFLFCFFFKKYMDRCIPRAVSHISVAKTEPCRLVFPRL